MKLPKDPKKWTGYDFLCESGRILEDNNIDSDSVICGAMMLAAVVHSPDLEKIAAATSIRSAILKPMFDRLVVGGVFKDGKICANWFDDSQSFVLDTLVGLGLAERAPAA